MTKDLLLEEKQANTFIENNKKHDLTFIETFTEFEAENFFESYTKKWFFEIQRGFRNNQVRLTIFNK